jgi:hypothetical protein
MKKLFYIFFITLLSSACAKELREDKLIQTVSERVFYYETRSGVVTITGKDLLRQLIRCQSDKLYMLQSQLEHKDGTWRLLISEEDAVSLGVDQKLYSAFVEVIDELNKTK